MNQNNLTVRTGNSAEFWRMKTAQAINANPNLKDAPLLDAHAKHLAGIKKALAAPAEEKPSFGPIKYTPPPPTGYSNVFWKTRAAEAIDADPHLGDSELLSALDSHMADLQKALAVVARSGTEDGSMIRDGMPPGPASVVGNARHARLVNERRRRDEARALVQDLMAKGNPYDLAFSVVRSERPELFGE